MNFIKSNKNKVERCIAAKFKNYCNALIEVLGTGYNVQNYRQ